MYFCRSGFQFLFAATFAVSSMAVTEASSKCADACDGTALDADGDGLDACIESCLGTSDVLIDSDSDGMSDSFEYRFGLDPLADDSQIDTDGDQVLNLDEFLQNSDPSDASSPMATYFLAVDGDDVAGLGTLERPWHTIDTAQARLTSEGVSMARLILLGGVYFEDVRLIPGLSIAGELDASVTIIGQISGAEGAALKNLTLEPNAGQAYLLDLNNVSMTLTDVYFVGSAERDVTGILMDGHTDGTLIDRCTFTRLGVGIDVGGSVPLVRRSTFSEIPAEFGDPLRPGAGIIIRAVDLPLHTQNSFGNESDPDAGWNDFLRSIEGFAVINERDTPVAMQGNYWGTVEPTEFPTRVSGAAVVLPVLAQRSAVLASSLFCTVWDSATQKRVGSAAITLAISTFNDVSRNTDGVYAFPAISEGQYSVHVKAPGFEEQAQELSITSGELKSVAIALRAVPAGHGEGQGDVAKGCALIGGGNAKGDQRAQGDIVLMAMVIVGMAASQRRRGNL